MQVYHHMSALVSILSLSLSFGYLTINAAHDPNHKLSSVFPIAAVSVINNIYLMFIVH